MHLLGRGAAAVAGSWAPAPVRHGPNRRLLLACATPGPPSHHLAPTAEPAPFGAGSL